MDEALSLPALADWLKSQPAPVMNPGQKKEPVQWDFASVQNCLVGQYLKATFPKPDKETPIPRFDDAAWSSMFHGETYMDRLRNYHFICDSKPYTYAGALDRINTTLENS